MTSKAVALAKLRASMAARKAAIAQAAAGKGKRKNGGRRGFWEQATFRTKALAIAASTIASLLGLLATYLQGAHFNDPVIEGRSKETARYERERAADDRARDKEMSYLRDQIEHMARESRTK